MARVLVAPHKFNGSLSAPQVGDAVAAGLREARPDVEVRVLPLADGGDGSVDAAVAAGFEAYEVPVSGPTGEPLTTRIAVRGDTAVVEIAAICGLSQLPGGVRQPTAATSYGVGEAVLAAARLPGVTRVGLALGGSATTDGGTGMLTALGARLLDGAGAPIGPGGGALAELATADLTTLDPVLARVRLTALADVDNPLLGERGAAAVFGPQKGATPEQVVALDAALGRLVDALDRDDAALVAGAGAAGGLGFAAVVLGAGIESGAGWFLDLLDLDTAAQGCDLVVTGEGSLDAQSLGGKLPQVVADRARRCSADVAAVVGVCRLETAQVRSLGFVRVIDLVSLAEGRDTEHDPELSAALLRRAGASLASLLPGPPGRHDEP